jgi:sec-independent protein translocase protein TatA
MLRNLFDNPWVLIILVVLVIALFGSKRLPDAARGLGRSMRIFKSEVKEMKNDGKDGETKASAKPAEPAPLDAPAPVEKTEQTTEHQSRAS